MHKNVREARCMNVHARRTPAMRMACWSNTGPTPDTRKVHAGYSLPVRRLRSSAHPATERSGNACPANMQRICSEYGRAFRWLCAACMLHACCMSDACTLHARCMHASCAGHSFNALATCCAFVEFVNMCALYALCMRTVYVQGASNTLCMRCQLASFFKILTKL